MKKNVSFLQKIREEGFLLINICRHLLTATFAHTQPPLNLSPFFQIFKLRQKQNAKNLPKMNAKRHDAQPWFKTRTIRVVDPAKFFK